MSLDYFGIRVLGYIPFAPSDSGTRYVQEMRKAIEAYCDRSKGIELVNLYVEETHGTSRNKPLPALDRLLMDIDRNKLDVDVVVLCQLFKFSHDLLSVLTALASVRSGIRIVFIDQRGNSKMEVESSSVATLVACAAKNLSSRISLGIKLRATRGMQHGAPPMGYERCNWECPTDDSRHRTYHVDENAEAVKEIFRLYDGGSHSLRTIARHLNERGFLTARGATFTASSVAACLRNPFYVGRLRYKDEIFEGNHEPIICEHIFDRVQTRLVTG